MNRVASLVDRLRAGNDMLDKELSRILGPIDGPGMDTAQPEGSGVLHLLHLQISEMEAATEVLFDNIQRARKI